MAKEGSELVTNCYQLKMAADDGKQRLTDVANAETLLRLVQSVPSPKAEPIKLWLAKMAENETAAKKGGKIAKRARQELEAQTGRNVVTGENYLPPGSANPKGYLEQGA